MDLSFLPLHYLQFLEKFGTDKLFEVRIRQNYPLRINYDNKIYTSANQFICTHFDIEQIISNVTEKSIYAYNEYIKKGFITTKTGLRIGLSGECVYDNGQVVTIKNFTSLNVRIPHNINNCSAKIFPFIYNDKIYNTLIISPPFLGKTTILKDLAVKLNNIDKYSILIVDERNEFSEIKGENIDVIKYGEKEYAFNYGIRSMSPNVIITDELTNKNDWECVKNAILSGVKVVASCHGKDIKEISNKTNFINVFDRYVILNNQGQAGVLKEVYDGDFKILWEFF